MMAIFLCFASLLVIVLFAILSMIEYKAACLTIDDEESTLLVYREAHQRVKKLAHSINSPAYVHVGSSKRNFVAQVNARLQMAYVAYSKLKKLKSGTKVNQVQRQLRSSIMVNLLKSSIEWFDWLERLLSRETQFRLTHTCVQDVMTSIEATLRDVSIRNSACKTRLEGQLAASKQALAEHEQFMVKTLDSLKADLTPTQAERDKFAQDEQNLHDKTLAIYVAEAKECKSFAKQLKSKNKPIYKAPKMCEKFWKLLKMNPKAYLVGAAAVGLAVAAYAPNYINHYANQKTAQMIDQDSIEMRA